jgi:hypothetical protein
MSNIKCQTLNAKRDLIFAILHKHFLRSPETGFVAWLQQGEQSAIRGVGPGQPGLDWAIEGDCLALPDAPG